MVILISKEMNDGGGYISNSIVARVTSKSEAEEFVLSYYSDKSNQDIKSIVSWKFTEIHGYESEKNRYSRVKFRRKKLVYVL